MPGPETRNPDIPAPTVAPLAAFPGVAPGATAMEVLRAVPDLVKSTPAAADLPATMAGRVPGIAPDPARFVPVETVRAMLSERNLTLATMSEARAADKVSDAMQRGYLSPAMKPWAPGTGNRVSGTGHRAPGTGHRKPGIGRWRLAALIKPPLTASCKVPCRPLPTC